MVDSSSKERSPVGPLWSEDRRSEHWLSTSWAALRAWLGSGRRNLLESLVHNLRENLLAMVELCPVAPIRQTHLGAWVGKRYGQGSGCRAPGQRAHLRLAKEEAA